MHIDFGQLVLHAHCRKATKSLELAGKIMLYMYGLEKHYYHLKNRMSLHWRGLSSQKIRYYKLIIKSGYRGYFSTFLCVIINEVMQLSLHNAAMIVTKPTISESCLMLAFPYFIHGE